MKFTLLVPTLNEIDGMKAVMPKIDKNWVDEILVIDAKSTDGTAEYARQNGYRVITQQSKGLVGAYREAVAQAMGDAIITFSPDGNSKPEVIPELIKKMNEGYDMVIASRYLPGAVSEDDDTVTAFGNWLFTTMINILFGARLSDSLVIFRVWKKKIFNFCETDAGAAGPDVHMSITCAKYGFKIGQIPADEPKRIGGVRKMDPLTNGFAILVLIFREFFTPKKTISVT